MAPPNRLTLHSSVSLRWWLYHLPLSRLAYRFLDEVLTSRSVTVAAVRDTDERVVDEAKRDLGREFQGDLSRSVTLDVFATFKRMEQAGILSWEDAEVATTLIVSATYGFSESDAAAMIVAEATGWPLLVADIALYERMRPLQQVSEHFSVLWLPDYMDAWDSA